MTAGATWPAAAYWPWRAAVAAEASTLHAQLFGAWQSRDWEKLIQIARRHLEADGGEGSQPHPFSRAAMEFFRPGGAALAGHDIERFVASFPRDAFAEYLERAAAADRNATADRALALHCLGALGQAEEDPIAGLRALIALAVAGRPGARESAANEVLVRQVLDAPVYLPGWSFQIDPASEPRPPAGERTKTPLEIKRERIAEHRKGPGSDELCVCQEGKPACSPPDARCAQIRYYIADLLELRDWTHRYKAGDLAYIEVVAAGETRSREHEMRRTRETFVETETSVRSLEKRDHQVSERASLQREIERQLDASTSFDASVEASYDAKAYKAKLTSAFSADRSASEAIRETQEKARELVTSAVSEIEKQTRSLRSERVTTEESEKNTHSFTNDQDRPRVTKYFWVTQEKRAQLFSYDKHLIAELIIPSPARLYEHLLEQKREAEVAKIPKPTLAKPIEPAAIPFGAADLTVDNYQSHAAAYGVANPPAPPEVTKYVSASTSYAKTVYGQKTLTPVSLQVPPDYHATAFAISGTIDPRLPVFSPRRVDFKLANNTVSLNATGTTSGSVSLGNLTGEAFVDVIAHNINNFSATLSLTVKINDAVLAAWQQAVFQLIAAKQEEKVAAYRTALEAYDAKWAEYRAACDKLREELRAKETARNPFYNREHERTQLKQAAIYMFCQDYSTEGAVLPRARPCGYPTIDRTQAEAKGYDWYFWDRMFDWKHISYAFFDYFWNPMCSWPDRLDPDEPDPLFKAFLRAGYARVLVPVSPDMESDFLWYASTRQKWGQTGEPPLDPNDPRWRNVVFELQYASESAMTPREGHIVGAAPGDLTLRIDGSDRYWDPSAGAPDPSAIALDVDRELLVDGAWYLIAGIQKASNSLPYDPLHPNQMSWIVTLSRPYEGAASPQQLYSMGAKAVAPVFSFDLPTELIWAGAHNECLPSYPLPPCPG